MEKLIFIPLISGMIGWFTNYIAVKMLFFPSEPKKILFLTFHGVIPKRIHSLAEKLSDLVANQLVNKDEIKEKLTENLDYSEVMKLIEGKIDGIIHDKIKTINPMVSMFLSDELIQKFKKILMEEVETMLPEIIKTLSDRAFENMDLKEEVRKKVLGFSTKEVEKLMWNMLKTEFKFIEALGAVLGVIIGLLQVLFLIVF